MKLKFISLIISSLLLTSCSWLFDNGGNTNYSSSKDSQISESENVKGKYKIDFDLNGGTSPSYKGAIYVNDLSVNDFFFDVNNRNRCFRGWSYEDQQIYDEKGNLVSQKPTMKSEMLFVAMYSDTIKLNITSNYENACTITGGGTIRCNSSTNIIIDNINPGYSLVGSFVNSENVSRQTNFTYQVANKDVDMLVKFNTNTFSVTVIAYNPNYGTVYLNNNGGESVSKDFDFGETVSLGTRDRSTTVPFLGWYREDGTLFSNQANYSFPMPSFNLKLYAKWDYFNVYYYLGGGENNANNPTHYSSTSGQVRLQNPTKSLDTFKGWQKDGQYVQYIDPLWLSDVSLEAVWKSALDGSTPSIYSNYVEYGLYPQTRVKDENLISSLNALTQTQSNGYYLYNERYYSKVSAKKAFSSAKFNDDTAVIENATYWFLCEPISWNFLKNSNGTYTLLSSVALDAHQYHTSTTATYDSSSLKSWLNGEFFNSAFKMGSSYIQQTSSNTDPAISYQNVFLLSNTDYRNGDYGFLSSASSDSSRKVGLTDFAIARGASYNEENTIGSIYVKRAHCWTRTKYSSSSAYCTNNTGAITYADITNSGLCVRPSITIRVI